MDNELSRIGYLSKSLFVKGRQCHKALYLQKHHPELADDVTDALEALFATGFEVHDLARELFPGGVLVPYEGLTKDDQVVMTREAMASGATAIYEASFAFDGIFVKVDLLRKGPEGWEIYEVKASTDEKSLHLDDLAVQFYVLDRVGVPLAKAFLALINNQYVRHGAIEPDKLFALIDKTTAVRELQSFIGEEIARMRAMLDGDIPDIDIGPHCSDPYGCNFHGHCWQHIPPDSVFDIAGKGIDRFDYYRRGIVRIADLPLADLNRRQAMQVDTFLTGTEYTDRGAIRSFLDGLWYPLCFLDFETFYFAIPPYDGTKPFQPIPFQYSLHALDSEGGELRHTEYLAPQNADPRKDLLLRLLADIPGNACVLMYTNYEKRILNLLTGWFPEHGPQIDDLKGRLVDLSAPFSAAHYYRRELKGSYSQKVVLPTLVPSLAYDDLEIREGLAASEAYLAMNACDDPAEVERVRNDLLKYCGRDTLGMVRILEKLHEMVGR